MNNALNANPQVLKHLTTMDPKLAIVISACEPIKIELSSDCFHSLASSIVGQQLSNKVTEIIWNRLEALMDYDINPQKIYSADIESLRKLGISYAKIEYIKNLSEAIINNGLSLDFDESLSDLEIKRQLTSIKGIGEWTAEMFLIFSLGREDIFSLGDGGLQRAIKWLYGLDEFTTNQQLLEITERWKPYRTYASLYLWEAIDSNLIGKMGEFR